MKKQFISQEEQQLSYRACNMLLYGKILVLNETTSNVHAKTDQLMQRIIREQSQDRTMITAAHQLNTIMDSDMVTILDKARLIKYSPTQDLLSRPQSSQIWWVGVNRPSMRLVSG